MCGDFDMFYSVRISRERFFSESVESAKDLASRGVESAKEAGSKVGEKGHGNSNESI